MLSSTTTNMVPGITCISLLDSSILIDIVNNTNKNNLSLLLGLNITDTDTTSNNNMISSSMKTNDAVSNFLTTPGFTGLMVAVASIVVATISVSLTLTILRNRYKQNNPVPARIARLFSNNNNDNEIMDTSKDMNGKMNGTTNTITSPYRNKNRRPSTLHNSVPSSSSTPLYTIGNHDKFLPIQSADIQLYDDNPHNNSNSTQVENNYYPTNNPGGEIMNIDKDQDSSSSSSSISMDPSHMNNGAVALPPNNNNLRMRVSRTISRAEKGGGYSRVSDNDGNGEDM